MDVLELFRNSKTARHISAGEALLQEGGPDDVMFVVVEGEAELTRSREAGEALTFGDVFGEMALIDDRPRSGTATASSDCELVPTNQEWLNFLICKNPCLATYVVSSRVDRLR